MVVDLLLGSGAHVHRVEPDQGETALHLAAESGNLDTITLLLRAGAFIDARGRHGHTPLMKAALCGHVHALQRLIDSRADPLATDLGGLNLRDFARGAVRTHPMFASKPSIALDTSGSPFFVPEAIIGLIQSFGQRRPDMLHTLIEQDPSTLKFRFLQAHARAASVDEGRVERQYYWDRLEEEDRRELARLVEQSQKQSDEFIYKVIEADQVQRARRGDGSGKEVSDVSGHGPKVAVGLCKFRCGRRKRDANVHFCCSQCFATRGGGTHSKACLGDDAKAFVSIFR